MNGGTNNPANPETFTEEDIPVELLDPTRDFYNFDEWGNYDDENFITDLEDVTVTAFWNPISYNINYFLDGGTNSVNNPANFNAEDSFPIVLEPATKAGHTFDGWFDVAVNGEQITEIEASDLGGAIELYAYFTQD